MKLDINKIQRIKVCDIWALGENQTLMALDNGVLYLEKNFWTRLRALSHPLGIDCYRVIKFIYEKEYYPKRGFYDWTACGSHLLLIKASWYSFLIGESPEDFSVICDLLKIHTKLHLEQLPDYMKPTIHLYKQVVENYVETALKAQGYEVFSDLESVLSIYGFTLEIFFEKFIDIIFWAHFPAGYKNWEGSDNLFNVLTQFTTMLMTPDKRDIGINLFSRMSEKFSEEVEESEEDTPGDFFDEVDD